MLEYHFLFSNTHHHVLLSKKKSLPLQAMFNLPFRKMKRSKSDDERDAEQPEETGPPMIIMLDGDEDKKSLVAETAEDRALVDVIAQVATTEDNPASLTKNKIKILVMCAVVQAVALILSMHFFTDPNKTHTFNMDHVVFLAGILKIMVACGLEYRETQGNLMGSFRLHIKENPRDAGLMLIPALLFEFEDWLSSIAVTNLRPHPFRLFQELRIIATALISQRILKTSYSTKQWLAMLAVWLGSYWLAVDHALSKTFWDEDSSNNFLGFETVTLAVVCSAVGGVYFEHVIKVVPDEGEEAPSLWMRVIQLSFFSLIFLAFRGGLKSDEEYSYFEGFGPLIWLLVLARAGAGLCVSLSIYYADNVLKCLAIAAGAGLAAVAFALLRDLQSSGSLFVFGCTVLGMGVWFYCKPLPRFCCC